MTSLKEYTEGRTTFLTADVEQYTEKKGQPSTDMPVFYNPRMRVNRDLSVIFLAAYMEQNRVESICEPLAGSGVRTLRYLNEIPGDFTAVLFDVNPLAIETARKNIDRYNFSNRARVIRGDAKILILTESREKRFDFVDVDPFGTPVPYLNAAVQSLNPRGGLLGLTATDMPALCGVYPQVALRKYGGISTRAHFSHELAVRLLLGRAYSIAAMNDCSIRPLAVLSTDHYIRAWIHVESNRTEANEQVDLMGTMRLCRSCLQTEVHSLRNLDNTFSHQRDECPANMSVAGPLWIGELFSSGLLDSAKSFYQKDYDSYHKRTGELFNFMIEEQDMTGYPYLDIHEVCDIYNMTPPKRSIIIESLIAKGYQVRRTHFQLTAIRTDAPVREVVSVIRELTGDS
ncbi:MAG: hypothetical protein ACFFEF_14160 [Candidatus Thorarchaeota archaeon]